MGVIVVGQRINIKNLINLFFSWGYVVNTNCYEEFTNYAEEMISRNRVAAIEDDGKIKAVMFFYITDDFNKVYKKSTWAIPEENPQGKQIYVDKFICQKVSLNLRRQLQDLIETSFPNQDELIYHRQPFDRLIRIRRRQCLKLAS